MASTSELQIAEITNIATGLPVYCFFNPKEYTLSKQNKWEEKIAKGETVPHMEFAGGATGSLKLQLLFDTYEAHNLGTKPSNRPGEDVRIYTTPLWDMMSVPKTQQNDKTGKGEPPACQFKWGTAWAFIAVIESISEKFILFKPDGTPLRSIIDISFKQLKDESKYPRQNPTSGGNPGDRIHMVVAGETLAGIAHAYYDDPTSWRQIAEANQIDNPRSLRPGTQLLVPALPTF